MCSQLIFSTYDDVFVSVSPSLHAEVIIGISASVAGEENLHINLVVECNNGELGKPCISQHE